MDPTTLDPQTARTLAGAAMGFAMFFGLLLGTFMGYALAQPNKTRKRFIHAAITAHIASGLHSDTEREVLADLQEKYRVGRLD